MVEIPPIHATSALSRGMLMAAVVEAQRQGAASVEAEHVLLALAADRQTPASEVLAGHGLDHESILRALLVERERSLAAVGMAPPPDAARLAATRVVGRPRWGASTQEVFRHAGEGASAAGRQGRHGVTVGDLLYGLLSLELGTLPRALAYADIDRRALRALVMEQAGIPASAPRRGHRAHQGGLRIPFHLR